MGFKSRGSTSRRSTSRGSASLGSRPGEDEDGHDLERALLAELRSAEARADDWQQPEREPRDWKKIVLVIGLGALSWVATYVGMLELIEANMGDLPLVHKLIIGFSVAMLMVMIVWLLDQMFAPIPFVTRVLYAFGYVFLTVISVGFGFGFYWKVLESRSEASRSAESAVSQVQGSLFAASSRLEQLQATLVQLTELSTRQAQVERDKGTTCPGSRPGDGPRRALRDADAGRFSFASDFVKGRVTQVRGELTALDGDLARIASADPATFDASGTRNEFMKQLSRKLDLTATGFNAFRTDPQLKQIRSDLAERAEKSAFPDTKGGTFACPDPQLQTALRGVVRAIDQLPILEKPKIATVEGSEAVVEAFRRLTATLEGLLTLRLPPSADELRELQKKAVQSVEGGPQIAKAQFSEQVGLSKRDYIPLAIALFVDLCLLLVSIGRPMNRLGGLVGKMQAAERGPVYRILSRFSDIHADPEVRQKFEVFRHVVFDWNGDYYVAVPLDAPRNRNPKEVEDLRLEAHLLSNLFASFEKERIFSRVFNPLLSTRTIQGKLWSQGSKFSGSQAFRVYRFRDGAWSEIILGAIMGAARRVEANKVRRAITEVTAAPAAPSVATPITPVAAKPEAPFGFDHVGMAPGPMQPVPVAPPVPTGQGRPTAPGPSSNPFVSAAPPALRGEPDAATAAAFGPYAAHLADVAPAPYGDRRRSQRPPLPVLPEAEVALQPANSNTGPALAQPGRSALAVPPAAEAADFAIASAPNVVRLDAGAARAPAPAWTPAPAPVPAASRRTALVAQPVDEPRVDVSFVERTATFSLPVSEARLPRAVLERMTGRPPERPMERPTERLSIAVADRAVPALVPPADTPAAEPPEPAWRNALVAAIAQPSPEPVDVSAAREPMVALIDDTDEAHRVTAAADQSQGDWEADEDGDVSLFARRLVRQPAE